MREMQHEEANQHEELSHLPKQESTHEEEMQHEEANQYEELSHLPQQESTHEELPQVEDDFLSQAT